mmetsp:Transcript_23368/g.44473  ORF Transcript_23368/g.44473 Transcript_23368/m.44473 type:complete len:227 (+) Transcript_23368:949-1629(+)
MLVVRQQGKTFEFQQGATAIRHYFDSVVLLVNDVLNMVHSTKRSIAKTVYKTKDVVILERIHSIKLIRQVGYHTWRRWWLFFRRTRRRSGIIRVILGFGRFRQRSGMIRGRSGIIRVVIFSFGIVRGRSGIIRVVVVSFASVRGRTEIIHDICKSNNFSLFGNWVRRRIVFQLSKNKGVSRVFLFQHQVNGELTDVFFVFVTKSVIHLILFLIQGFAVLLNLFNLP